MASHVVSAMAITRPGPKRNLRCWSELPVDIMRLIFERLGFADFERAKSVCSTWNTGSRQSKPSNKIPWMILRPEEKNYCLLFNPEDREGKLYKTQHLGDAFTDSHCLATCGSWLLMDPSYGNREGPLYILHLLTRERINLPPTTSDQRPGSLILWIDDKTKDYLVIGETLVYLKKGDNSWKKISEGIQDQEDMVFKDHKLYCLANDELSIFDFSGEFPLQVSRVSIGGGCVIPEKRGLMVRLPRIPWHVQEDRSRNNVVVTVRGDVLIVRSESPFMSETWNFEIFKMDSSKGLEEIVSLGDEAIVLNLGITVLAKHQEGVISNCIYFTGDEINWYDTEIFVFNLDTKKVEQLPPLVSSSASFSRARWFLPSFRND
ncbi:F-box domain-containing protein [Hirschfeldia incana]|nr:F-box domain-containing protein [Hirschfeldia incana]